MRLRSLVLAALSAFMLLGATSTAFADWDRWQRHQWRERAWRQHEWRESHWRHHRPHWGGPVYGPPRAYGYYAPPPPPAYYVNPGFGFGFTVR